RRRRVGLEAVRLAITAEPGISEHLSLACAAVAGRIVHFGGTVVVPENSPLLQSKAFVTSLLPNGSQPRATIAYGERFVKPGVHIMQTPTDHPVETLTGLGATGVEVMLVCITKAIWQSHPMVPVIQLSDAELSQDLDVVIRTKDANRAADEMLGLIVRVLGRQYTPKLFAQGNTDFQMTRGLLGVSL
ncbi:MAG TPA: altronate hydrolase, partial [Verrucomicrobiae bacterium]|nr:altronate hydrolase [Verrucomicrobiae bacterium]